jgi:hypothetical protein
VGFRASAQWVAAGRPLTGWVRNREDGSVLLEVQGERFGGGGVSGRSAGADGAEHRA